jgi:alkylation response protein AidB-like acyl-CoA dehydrogenase
VTGLRAEARAWLAAHVPTTPLPSVDTREGFAAHRAWERGLAAAGLAVVTWPIEYGGRDASLLDWLAFEEEYYAAGAPVRVGQNGLFLLAPTLFAHATAAQRDRLLPPMATGEEIWAQAWSEPEAGSDLAAIRSRAVPADGGWRLSGTKIWSSRAAFADRAFGLFRTGPATVDRGRAAAGRAPGRHQGLTYLLFGLRDPGVTVRPIRQLGGETGFAEIFLDDVFVPDADVVGAPGDGWRIAMSTAGHERGLSLRSPGRFLAAASRLAELWRQSGSPASSAIAERVADAWIGARAYQLHTAAAAARLAVGGTLGAETSMGKVFWSELDLALHETALELLGPRAEVRGERWLEGYLFALAGPIYAGTNEIQRTVIAERVLGLPRSASPRASSPQGSLTSQGSWTPPLQSPPPPPAHHPLPSPSVSPPAPSVSPPARVLPVLFLS